MKRKLIFSIFVISLLIFVSCGGGNSGGGTSAGSTPVDPCGTSYSYSCTSKTGTTINISWTANKEADVNSSGGGYKIYYSKTSSFKITDSGVSVIDVPYTSTSTTTPVLSKGTWYFRVVAYSAVDGTTLSCPSSISCVTLN